MIDAKQACPCASGETYTNCCQLLHQGKTKAQTAAQLMRSRYSAYTFKLIDYLVKTTHPDKRPENLRQEISDWANRVEFYRLEIISTWQGLATDKSGKVEFIAHFLLQDKEQLLCEISRFKRYRKDWVYLDGEIGK